MDDAAVAARYEAEVAARRAAGAGGFLGHGCRERQEDQTKGGGEEEGVGREEVQVLGVGEARERETERGARLRAAACDERPRLSFDARGWRSSRGWRDLPSRKSLQRSFHIRHFVRLRAGSRNSSEGFDDLRFVITAAC